MHPNLIAMNNTVVVITEREGVRETREFRLETYQGARTQLRTTLNNLGYIVKAIMDKDIAIELKVPGVTDESGPLENAVY